MAKNRKAFIEMAIKCLNEIDPGNPSIPIIKKSLESMSKEHFEDYIERLRNGISEDPDLDKPREILPIVVPNLKPTKITTESNIKLAKKWGHSFFERIRMYDHSSGTAYLTNIPYTLIDIPVMRQAQTLEAKISVDGGNTHLDDRTDQASDTVKGASFSGPELQCILSQGRQSAAIELMKFRGGDDKAFRRMQRDLMETGTFSQDAYLANTRAKSTDVVGIYFKACHFDTDI